MVSIENRSQLDFETTGDCVCMCYFFSLHFYDENKMEFLSLVLGKFQSIEKEQKNKIRCISSNKHE